MFNRNFKPMGTSMMPQLGSNFKGRIFTPGVGIEIIQPSHQDVKILEMEPRSFIIFPFPRRKGGNKNATRKNETFNDMKLPVETEFGPRIFLRNLDKNRREIAFSLDFHGHDTSTIGRCWGQLGKVGIN